ncbi:MAG: hypothetical protein A2939_04420 [Parcubacteria group bacterium RIFCSPLOWO2_01_FULL_48_18]|nr:MAG: hypothetical protein A3J67_03700 [Parcubacteria group bacterium RIFCSPHIGHO2_02_FULL_48_10b]OHB22624.1 MAG: hypothetical protein A2939_04420 [Parcubacteria group bacterium RIFCSPLOWO2_01_FULL_48_18]
MEYLPERKQEHQETKRVFIRSEIESADGTNKEIAVKLEKDGKPRALAFFDIDATLAELRFIYDGAIKELFPNVDPREITETFRAGWGLGNSFREFDRMQCIYEGGKESWRDAEVYVRERLKEHQEEIDSLGTPAHEQADLYRKRFAEIVARRADKFFEENPEQFEAAKVKPIFRLAELYHRLGIPMVLMTANENIAARKIAKYLGLSDLFIDIAADETMEGGGKEKAMEYLMNRLREKGIEIPKDRIIIVGDSLRGDIGSGTKLKEHHVSGQRGILVIKDEEVLAELNAQIANSPDLQRVVSEIDTEALLVDKVPLDSRGDPILSSKYRSQFLRKLP